MRISTVVIVIGVILFVIPFPGTFIAGAIVAIFGAFLRWFGL